MSILSKDCFFYDLQISQILVSVISENSQVYPPVYNTSEAVEDWGYTCFAWENKGQQQMNI